MNKAQVLVLAAATAPLVTALVFLATFLFEPDQLMSPGLTFVVVYVAAFLCELVLGGPLFYLGHRFALVRWWTGALAGLLVGLIVVGLLRMPSLPDLKQVAGFGGAGAASGFAFWVVLRIGSFIAPSETVAARS